MELDFSQHYDKIYRYCYFRLHNRDLAEDVTQEAFLRFFVSETYRDTGQALRYLYTIARNLCIDQFQRPETVTLPDDISVEMEDRLDTHLDLRAALEQLSVEERELILLRYVNEVPVSVLSGVYGISRFALRRRLQTVTRRLRKTMEQGGRT